MQSFSAFIDFDLAQSLDDFEAAIPQLVTSHNFLYADWRGNIAYWQGGQVPLRPKGTDPRLPLPGDGSAEWPGGNRPVPASINPAQGFLANWNNKPQLGYPNADSQILGKQFRVVDLQDDLSGRTIAFEDMENIPKDIARFGSLGRESRYLKQYLLDALVAVPPSDRFPLPTARRTGKSSSSVSKALSARISSRLARAGSSSSFHPIDSSSTLTFATSCRFTATSNTNRCSCWTRQSDHLGSPGRPSGANRAFKSSRSVKSSGAPQTPIT